MLLRLFLLFTLVPLVELVVLIRLGALFGFGPTLLLVLGTGMAGAWLARREGLRSWRAVQAELGEGRLPGEELVHGLLILGAGIVLITPGVFTDLAGILLLVRPVRTALIRRVRTRMERTLESEAADRRPRIIEV
ncbi:MAG: FxsA family protein [Gemmatimonadota bacterium]